MTPIEERLSRAIERRRSSGTFRSLPQTRAAASRRIDCSTNSYLGLHTNSEIAAEALRLSGTYTGGNLASRLVAQQSDLYRLLEEEIAAWEGTESSLVFTSGYTANVGILQALCGRTTEVFCDRLNHASIYDGIRLSGGKLTRYRHCDMSDLRKRLRQSTSKEKVIVTDTVFSMDGDRAPLEDIAQLARESGALVCVDEAHATGIFGGSGSGRVEETGTAEGIAVRMGTFSKALAGLGGYVATTAGFRDIFINFSRSLIYSTGLPPVVLAHNLSAVRHMRSHPGLGTALLRSAASFRRDLIRSGYSTRESSTQIVPCIVRNEREAVNLMTWLRERDIHAPAVRPPTVPAGTSRIRFSWSLLHTDDDRSLIIDHLKRWRKAHG